MKNIAKVVDSDFGEILNSQSFSNNLPKVVAKLCYF